MQHSKELASPLPPRTTGGRIMEAATFEMVLTARAEVERLDLPRQLAA